jgi:hypothetical protein
MVSKKLIPLVFVLLSLSILLLFGIKKNYWLVKMALAQEFPEEPVQCFPNNTKIISMHETAQHALTAGFEPDQGNQGSDAATIVAIAWAESRNEIFACNYNPPVEISLGILQINILDHESTFTDEDNPTIAKNLDIVFNPDRSFKWAFINLLRNYSPCG